MLETRPKLFPLYIAVSATVALTWLMTALPEMSESPEAVFTVGLLGVLVNILVPILWGVTTLAMKSLKVSVVAALVWILAVSFWAPIAVFLPIACVVAAGVAAGMVLSLRWRIDAALLLVALALSPGIIWTTAQMPVNEQIQLFRTEMLNSIQQGFPESADEQQRALALKQQGKQIDQAAKIAEQIYPATVSIGLLGQAGVIIGLVLLAGRRMQRLGLGRSLPSFGRWQFPFYLVWLTIISIGLFITRATYLSSAGLNVMIVVGLIISLQGMAVQFFITKRSLSPLGHMVFWAIMGVFLIPVLLASGIMLGLADMWFDFRRLNAAGQSDSDLTEDSDDSEDRNN